MCMYSYMYTKMNQKSIAKFGGKTCPGLAGSGYSEVKKKKKAGVEKRSCIIFSTAAGVP